MPSLGAHGRSITAAISLGGAVVCSLNGRPWNELQPQSLKLILSRLPAARDFHLELYLTQTHSILFFSPPKIGIGLQCTLMDESVCGEALAKLRVAIGIIVFSPLIRRQRNNFFAGGIRSRTHHLAEVDVRKRSGVTSDQHFLAWCSAKSNIWLHRRLSWLV